MKTARSVYSVYYNAKAAMGHTRGRIKYTSKEYNVILNRPSAGTFPTSGLEDVSAIATNSSSVCKSTLSSQFISPAVSHGGLNMASCHCV